MRQRTAIGTVISAVLCTAVLLLTGCAADGAEDPTGSGEARGMPAPDLRGAHEHRQNAALGGVQPHSSEPAVVVMESAVANTDALMQHLGGRWDFPNEAGPFDAERVRAESNPQTCTTSAGNGPLTDGGMYLVGVTSVAPDESAEETLERFEAALRAVGYETLEGNGTGPGEAEALANGQSAEGRVTLTRSAGNLSIQLRTACSTDPSLG